MMASNNVEKIGVADFIRNSYLSYAKSTIVDRAFCYIDGLKPVDRRLLYDMFEIGAVPGKSKKSARIVGDTMGKYHPHGDSSIYGALVNLTGLHEYLNNPLVDGVGSFGKSWSVEHFVPAAMRYTEANLSQIAFKEFFNGINEDAVDMIDNFSKEFKEPRVLPTTFPNILVNNTNGIAVGVSSYIPTYTLKGACQAVKALIETPDIDDSELSKLIGNPDFITGGNIHISEDQRLSLLRTGYAKGIYLTGSYSFNRNQITIYELPFNTNVERFIEELTALYKDKKLAGVKSIDNTSGRTSGKKSTSKNQSNCKLKVEIGLTSSADVDSIIRTIRQYTSFSNSISFNTRFVWWNSKTEDYDYKECGVRDLISKYWLPWRLETVKRIYTFRRNKLYEKKHLLDAWMLIKDNLDDVIAYARAHKRAEFISHLKREYRLDEFQAKYIADKKISSLSTDEIEASILESKKINNQIEDYTTKLNNDYIILKEIAKDMERIINNYGDDSKCNSYDLTLIQEDKEAKTAPIEIPDVQAWVGITASGNIKRVLREDDALRMEYESEIPLFDIIECMNKDTLVVFTSSGFAYKIPVYSVESSRGNFKDSLWKMVERDNEDRGEIIHVIATRNYEGNFRVVYNNGEGWIIPYKHVSGNRSKYKSVYPEFKNKETGFILNPTKFFVVTKYGNAAYMNIEPDIKYASIKGKQRFKLPRLRESDVYACFIDEREIKDLEKVSIDRFKKPYCVKLGEDKDIILASLTR